jgi:hypothetical protein
VAARDVQRFATAGPPEMHAVDLHLGRHSRALRHLMSPRPPRFDAALTLARDKVTAEQRCVVRLGGARALLA